MIEELHHEDAAEMRRVWNQRSIPIVLRRSGKQEKIRVRFPTKSSYHDWFMADQDWVAGIGKSDPHWNRQLKCWELPKSWFNKFVVATLEHFGQLYVIQPYREYEVCAPACQNATGHECQCSCMGEHHGTGGDSSWFEICETFAFRWGDKSLACRLMRRK